MGTPLKYNSETKYNSGWEYNTPYKIVVLIRAISERYGFQDTWKRFRYNARHLYNKTYIRYAGMAVYVISRERTRIIGQFLNLTEVISKAVSRICIRAISERYGFQDTWKKFRYNTGYLYSKTYIRYTGMAVYVISRERTRIIDQFLNLKELSVRACQQVKMLSENLQVSEILDRALVRVKIAATDTLGLVEALNYARDRYRAVKDILEISENVPLKLRALLTIMAVAVTRGYLEARALTRITKLKATVKTRTILRCQIGREINVILEVDRGRDKTYEVSVTDESGRIFDLTDGTVYFMVKKTVKDDDLDAVITLDSTIPAQIEITDATGGLCEIHLVPGDTSALPVRRYVYEVVVVDKDGKKYKVAMDDLVLKHVVKKS